MKQLRRYIRGLIKEMAYIDEYPPGYTGSPLQDPEVAANYHDYAERMKKKRANPPRTWQKVLNVLSSGGSLVEAGKSYLLYDANSKPVGSIRKKTFEELSDSGFLEGHESYDGIYILSDEGQGYLQ